MLRSFQKFSSVLLLLVVLLAGCVPGAQLFAPPTFSLVVGDSGVVRLDPPGIGSGDVTLRLALDVHNPNPIGVRLAGVDGTLFLNGRRVADTAARNGIDLPASGRGRLTLDTTIPLTGATALIADLASMVSGAPTELRLDAAVAVNVFGALQRLPAATLVRTTIEAPILIAAPVVSLDLARSGLRDVGPTGATVVLALTIDNPNPIGFGIAAPALELSFDGRQVAIAELAATPVPALSATSTELTVSVRFAELGPVLAARVGLVAAGAATLDVALVGPLLLEAPGIATVPLPPLPLVSTTF
jgi:LEA14-like dessication related protein